MRKKFNFKLFLLISFIVSTGQVAGSSLIDFFPQEDHEMILQEAGEIEKDIQKDLLFLHDRMLFPPAKHFFCIKLFFDKRVDQHIFSKLHRGSSKKIMEIFGEMALAQNIDHTTKLKALEGLGECLKIVSPEDKKKIDALITIFLSGKNSIDEEIKLKTTLYLGHRQTAEDDSVMEPLKTLFLSPQVNGELKLFLLDRFENLPRVIPEHEMQEILEIIICDAHENFQNRTKAMRYLKNGVTPQTMGFLKKNASHSLTDTKIRIAAASLLSIHDPDNSCALIEFMIHQMKDFDLNIIEYLKNIPHDDHAAYNMQIIQSLKKMISTSKELEIKEKAAEELINRITTELSNNIPAKYVFETTLFFQNTFNVDGENQNILKKLLKILTNRLNNNYYYGYELDVGQVGKIKEKVCQSIDKNPLGDMEKPFESMVKTQGKKLLYAKDPLTALVTDVYNLFK